MAREVHAVLAVPDHSARIAAWRRFEHVHESGHGNRVGLAWSPAKRSRRSLDRSRRARHPAVTVERSPAAPPSAALIAAMIAPPSAIEANEPRNPVWKKR
jgi:hypothetical protein